MSKTALCPGSFDPITSGHVAWITRVACLFDMVYVVVADNETKRYDFTADERVHLCEKALEKLSNVRVIRCDGLLVDTFRRVGATVIVKGIRNEDDYKYEAKMAEINKSLEPTAETLFLCAEQGTADISSSGLKHRLKNGEAVMGWLPEAIENEILNRYNER